ncbi:hypothetical protein [Cutibacterium acnes]|uniref:hypothetical protein n=1 Tax=Cutibacterium acnes TaxID=1747 RepID=UPI0012E29038|nr:hypothetical protein [Cutibacterium acnes]MUT18709.1 hypothetical protein [Cutibacterium acnes]
MSDTRLLVILGESEGNGHTKVVGERFLRIGDESRNSFLAEQQELVMTICR